MSSSEYPVDHYSFDHTFRMELEQEAPKTNRYETVLKNTEMLDTIPQYEAAHRSAVMTLYELPSLKKREMDIFVSGRSVAGKGTVSRSEAIRLSEDPYIKKLDPQIKSFEEKFDEPVAISELHYADIAVLCMLKGPNDENYIEPPKDQNGNPVFKTRGFTEEERLKITQEYKNVAKRSSDKLHEQMWKKYKKEGYIIRLNELSQLNMTIYIEPVPNSHKIGTIDTGRLAGTEIHVLRDNGDSYLFDKATGSDTKATTQFWWVERFYSDRLNTLLMRETWNLQMNKSANLLHVFKGKMRPHLKKQPHQHLSERSIQRETSAYTETDLDKLKSILNSRVGSVEGVTRNDELLNNVLMSKRFLDFERANILASSMHDESRIDLFSYIFSEADYSYFEDVVKNILQLGVHQYHWLQNYAHVIVDDYWAENPQVSNLAVVDNPALRSILYP